MKCKCGNEMTQSNKNEYMFECSSCNSKKHKFEEVLKEYKKTVQEKLFEFFDHEIPGVSELKREEIQKEFWEIAKDYPKRGGKYIRPALILMACEALGGKKEEAILTGAAMEISQNWLLIHDDWEDGSEMRRGKPVLNKLYSSEIAINAGDALQAIQWYALKGNIKLLGVEKTEKIFDEFYRILMRTVLGQHTEIKWYQENNFEIGFDGVYYIFDGKTSYYTTAGPLRLGAIIAGKDDEKTLNILTNFGVALGRGFQIIDDLLDLVSDFRGLKKRGGDIIEGKRTLMLMHLHENVKGQDKELLNIILSKKRKERTYDDVEIIINLMEKYGSIEYGKAEAKKNEAKARRILNEELNFIKPEAKEKFLMALDFIFNRDF